MVPLVLHAIFGSSFFLQEKKTWNQSLLWLILNLYIMHFLNYQVNFNIVNIFCWCLSQIVHMFWKVSIHMIFFCTVRFFMLRICLFFFHFYLKCQCNPNRRFVYLDLSMQCIHKHRICDVMQCNAMFVNIMEAMRGPHQMYTRRNKKKNRRDACIQRAN